MEKNYAKQNNVQLKNYNTLGLESIAHTMLFPLDYFGVEQIYEDYKNAKKIVIGKGSNLLLSKEYYDEDYVFINLKLIDFINLKREAVYCGAGATLSQLSWFSVEKNISGFEFLEDIPGTVGGAIIMNAGTYEDNISQLIEKITYYDIIEKKLVIDETVQSDNFERRSSKWNRNLSVILAAEFTADKGDYMTSLEKLLEIKRRRYLKQPRNYYNAGSVFKRPIINGEEYFVWKLVTDCGLRGLKRNDAMISDKHTGFIVNLGRAKFSDIEYLINLIKTEVKKQHGIELELEWKIL